MGFLRRSKVDFGNLDAECAKLTKEGLLKEIENELNEADEYFKTNVGVEKDDSDKEKDGDEDNDGVSEEKKAGWELRKIKYAKYGDEGKVEKLKKAIENQTAKAEKAEDQKKSQAYIDYKWAKVSYTKIHYKRAVLVHNLQQMGMVGKKGL